MTAEQYHAWSVEGDRTQLVAGEVVLNDPKPMHALLQARLIGAIAAWIEAGADRGLVMGPTSLTLDEENVYGPDLLWFSEANRPTDLREYPQGVSDLCVEIRSPGTWRYDVGTKRIVYERTGLPELWLVDDRAETVLVYRRSAPGLGSFDVALELDRGETLSSPLMPGFALPLEQLSEQKAVHADGPT
jgi:Uma2 family endonuclease